MYFFICMKYSSEIQFTFFCAGSFIIYRHGTHTLSYKDDAMKKTVFVSAFHLIYISVLAKILSFLVRILLARKLGSEAMNYYSLTAPTMVFLISMVQQGIPGALSKLSAQKSNPRIPLYASAVITAVTVTAVILLYSAAIPFLAHDLLHETKLIPILQAILPLLPAVALSGVLKGYLYGIQHHYQANATQLYEEAARILFLIVCFSYTMPHDPIDLAVTAMYSVCAGEIASCLYMMLHLKFSYHHVVVLPKALKQVNRTDIREVLKISMPMMGSRISGSLTYFLEPILMLVFVSESLKPVLIEAYGSLNGYTLPLLTMPSFLSITLSNYLLPAFSYALAHRQSRQAKKSCMMILSCCLCFGIGYSLLCFFFHEQLFQLFYHTTKGSHQLRLLSLPFLLYSLQPPLSSLLHACSMSSQAFTDTLLGSCFRLASVCFLASYFQENALLFALSGGMMITTILHAARLLYFFIKRRSHANAV